MMYLNNALFSVRYEGNFVIRGGNMVEKVYFLLFSKEGEFLTQILNTTTLYLGIFTDIDV